MTGTSNNRAGGERKRTLLTQADVLRERCRTLTTSDAPDIPAAVLAVYEYATAFLAGIPTMPVPDCDDAGCDLCVLYVPSEVSLAGRYVALFLSCIEDFCQQMVSTTPQEEQTARLTQRWIDACRAMPEEMRFRVLLPPYHLPA